MWLDSGMNTNYQIGNKVSLPDGGYGPIVRIEDGVEYGAPVLYVTIINGLGNEETRWVRV
jgi:hypothetical protein